MFFCFFFPLRSAFFIFCSEFRPKVKGESPGLSIGDVAKRLGEMWNGTAAEDKQPYEKKAAKLKEKYEKVRVKCELRLSSDSCLFLCLDAGSPRFRSSLTGHRGVSCKGQTRQRCASESPGQGREERR